MHLTAWSEHSISIYNNKVKNFYNTLILIYGTRQTHCEAFFCRVGKVFASSDPTFLYYFLDRYLISNGRLQFSDFLDRRYS